jgi:hypothetical protein
MRKVSEYRQHADECLAMARRAKEPEQRKQLVEMADAWIMLADERAAQIAKRSANGIAAFTPADNDHEAI